MREIFVLTHREFRSAFRETSVVLYSILLPLLLYPFLLWLMVTAMTFIEGQQEKRIYRVAYEEKLKSSRFRDFLQFLEKNERLRLSAKGAEGALVDAHITLKLKEDSGESILVEYESSRPESQDAQSFVLDLGADYNLEAQKNWLAANNLSPESSRPFLVKGTSISGSGELGGYLLGALLPIGLLVMIALGGAYPAIDTTAGERERGTWETLQSCQPSLAKIVVSKYLFVALVCCLSGVLNLFAMLVSIRSIVAPLLRNNSEVTFSIGPVTLLVLLLGVITVSFFVAAALLLSAIFARTFREGQALTTPMFMLIAVPVLPLSDPGLQLNSTLAFVPLVNLALVWRQALQGHYPWVYIFQTLGTLLVLIAIALWFGAQLLKNESLMSGQSSFGWRGLKGALVSIFGARS